MPLYPDRHFSGKERGIPEGSTCWPKYRAVARHMRNMVDNGVIDGASGKALKYLFRDSYDETIGDKILLGRVADFLDIVCQDGEFSVYNILNEIQERRDWGVGEPIDFKENPFEFEF